MKSNQRSWKYEKIQLGIPARNRMMNRNWRGQLGCIRLCYQTSMDPQSHPTIGNKINYGKKNNLKILLTYVASSMTTGSVDAENGIDNVVTVDGLAISNRNTWGIYFV